MGHRIREAWTTSLDRFNGPVEADETFIGGKETNKHASKKIYRGRGTAGKTPVAGIKDRPTTLITTTMVPYVNRATLQPFVMNQTTADATVYTDEASAYVGINRYHESTVHSKKLYVQGPVHTNGIESHWALLKRGLHGIYHHVTTKHLNRYLAEFSGRHNFRPKDTEDQMTRLVEGAVGKLLRYCDLIGPHETRIHHQ